MHFKPSRLEARVALNGDQYHELVARQGGFINTDDPFESFLTSLFGGGEDTETTTATPRTTTTRAITITEPSIILTEPSIIPTDTRTTTSTPVLITPAPQTRTTAQVVTTPPPQITQPTQQFTTTTSTTSVQTANAAASQANTNSTSNGGLPSVVVGIIVAASVIFGLIFIALIARKIFQSRRRNKRNTWAVATGVTPFDAPITEKALPPPPPPAENQAYPSINHPAYPPTAVPGITAYSSQQPYSPAAASSAGYTAPYPFGTNGNAPPLMQQNWNNTTTAAAFTAADLAGPVVIQHTPPTPPAAAAGAAISVVKRTFVPSLPDELPINNGDQVRILSAYDDGWALCEKVASGEKGVVPQECLEMVNQASSGASTTGSEESRLNRNSSLRRGPDQTQ